MFTTKEGCSNTNEVIRPVLNFLVFYKKISQVQKSTKQKKNI